MAWPEEDAEPHSSDGHAVWTTQCQGPGVKGMLEKARGTVSYATAASPVAHDLAESSPVSFSSDARGTQRCMETLA